MRIAKLHMANFMSHRDTGIDLSPITIVVGPNNAGKTAIADAIEMLLLGHCRCTDKRGAGSGELITDGENGFELSATIDDLVITRLFKMFGKTGQGEFSVSNWTGNAKAIQQKFLDDVAGGVSGDTLGCIIRASTFIDMRHDERRTFLFALQGGELDKESILLALGDWYLDDVQEEVRNSLIELHETGKGDATYTQILKFLEKETEEHDYEG